MITIDEWDGKQTDVVINADIKQVLHKMEITADLTFTSPPYGVEKVTSAYSAGLKADKRKETPYQYHEYDSIDDEYDGLKCYMWLDAIKDKSHITFWNIPAKQFDRNFGLTEGMLAKDTIGQVIWQKPNSMPFPKRGIIYFHETIWVLGDKERIKKPFKSIWTFTNQRWSKHPAPFPPELPAKAIQHCTNEGDIVFDPFGGSGTTAAVAKALGRRYITCDISKQYCEWIDERLAKTKTIE